MGCAGRANAELGSKSSITWKKKRIYMTWKPIVLKHVMRSRKSLTALRDYFDFQKSLGVLIQGDEMMETRFNMRVKLNAMQYISDGHEVPHPPHALTPASLRSHILYATAFSWESNAMRSVISLFGVSILPGSGSWSSLDGTGNLCSRLREGENSRRLRVRTHIIAI